MKKTFFVLLITTALAGTTGCSNSGFLVDNSKTGVLSSRAVFAIDEGSAEGSVRGTGANSGAATGSLPGSSRGNGPASGDLPAGGGAAPSTGSFPGTNSGTTTGNLPGGGSWPTSGFIPGGNSTPTTGSLPTNTSTLPKNPFAPQPAGTDGYIPPTNSNLPNPGPTEVPYSFMCSRSQMERSNKVALAAADSLEISLKDLGDHTVCVVNKSEYLNDLKTKKVIDFGKIYADCASQSKAFNTTHVKEIHIQGGVGASRATLDNTEGGVVNVVAKVGSQYKVTQLDLASGNQAEWASYQSAVSDRRTVTSGQARPGNGSWYLEVPYVFFDGRLDFADDFAYTDGSACDYELSPLIVRLSDASGPISLSAPWYGRTFDILGLNSFPVAHTPKMISWFLRPGDYFIALPDSQGRVNGIEELFGNNTSGPDGQFAANGYAALRKYDGLLFDGSIQENLADGVIDRRDPIFTALRLWRDDNLDAVAQPTELFTLDELQITEIDLDFDPNYVERDRWGNETRMKSTIKTTDGKLHLMYDLWFSRAAVR